MLSQRTWTLLGSDLLFIGVSLALFVRPELSAALYPAYGLLFLWSDFRREGEAPVIFLFLVTAAGLLLIARAGEPALKVALAGELLSLWLLSAAVSAHRAWALGREREGAVERASLQARRRDDERDLRYYRDFAETARQQIRLRRDLAESAKSLGSTMDSRELHARLLGALSARFPGARVALVASAEGDPLLERAAQRKGPVLVKDAQNDARLQGRGFRSAVALPLKVMRQDDGFLKVESDAPNAFGPEDVRTVDLFATMAALSLENIRFYEQVHSQALHDPLTQLYSHRAFQERLQEELLRAGRSQTPLSIILCDLDHFKTYNDRYGHQAGDHLLRTVSAILASFARPVDMAARYGGEEFALILPNFVRSEAVDLANRIRLRVCAEPFIFQGQATRATMSLGVASYPQDATTASQMVRAADERLYKAKHGGRNQVVG